jgi:uncharacterized protein (TIGR02391 family)
MHPQAAIAHQAQQVATSRIATTVGCGPSLPMSGKELRVARREYSAEALLPYGYHQNWDLIDKIIDELERVTAQWVDAETSITCQGKQDLYSHQSSLIDAKIDLGDDIRDVTEVNIQRSENDDDSDGQSVVVSLCKTQKSISWVFATGPSKKRCEDLARSLQRFILECIKHPEVRSLNSSGASIEGRLQHLHSEIRSGAMARLAMGHGDEAVEHACKSIGARLRHMTGLDDDGASLVTRCLGKEGLLAINSGTTRSEQDEQQGIMHLGLALYRAARNPRAHRPSDPNYDETEVVEWLNAASAFHRALDRAGARSTLPPKGR